MPQGVGFLSRIFILDDIWAFRVSDSHFVVPVLTLVTGALSVTCAPRGLLPPPCPSQKPIQALGAEAAHWPLVGGGCLGLVMDSPVAHRTLGFAFCNFPQPIPKPHAGEEGTTEGAAGILCVWPLRFPGPCN